SLHVERLGQLLGAFAAAVIAPARHLDPQRHATVAALHRAPADDEIAASGGETGPRRKRAETRAHAVVRHRVETAAGLDRNAVVAGIERTVLNKHVGARFRIAAVVVGSEA